MIRVNFKEKGMLGIFLAAVIMAGIIGAHQLQAAERVDTSATVTISAKVSENDSSVFASEYKGIVEVDVYKIATLSETAEAALTSDFADSGINLDVLKENPSSDTIKTEIVNKAIAKVKSANLVPKDDEIIKLDRSQGVTKSGVEFTEGAGLYLYIPRQAQDERYTYTFTPYVTFAPTSDYIASNGAEGADDTWDYNPVFALKSEAKPRFGNLEIKKTLDNYNESLGEQSFVYNVKAVLDEDPEDEIEGEVVLNTVYTINFSSAGTGTKSIEHIPATAVVTITEAYPGSSYEPVDETQMTQTVTIVGNETQTVEFENTYNGNIISGGIAAENKFEIEDGVTYWINENGAREEQLRIPEERIIDDVR